jgi:AraC-like DNA-binding protein
MGSLNAGLDASEKLTDWRVFRLYREATENYGRPDLSVAGLSCELRVSARRLNFLFKRHFGAPYRVFLQRTRLQAAAKLLSESSLSVKEVAGAVGYTAVSNFDRDFRHHYDMTPGSYRWTNLTAISGPSGGTLQERHDHPHKSIGL